MRRILAVLVGVLVAVAEGAGDLVAPGALTTGGGGAGGVGHPRRGGRGIVGQWPAGFFVGGSSRGGMNGLYVDATDEHGLPFYCFRAYRNLDSGWTLSSAAVQGRWRPAEDATATDEWVIADDRGRHVVASKAGHYIPGVGTSWRHVFDERRLRNFARGDAVAARGDADGLWADGDAGTVLSVQHARGEFASVRWRRAGGREFTVRTWHLDHVDAATERTLDERRPDERRVAAAGDDDDLASLPWQVVAMMDRQRLDDLVARYQEWRDEMDASRRRGRGSLAQLGATFGRRAPDDGAPDDGAGRLLKDGSSFVEACAYGGAAGEPGRAWALCAEGLADEAAALLEGDDSADAHVARAYCARRRGDAGAALGHAADGLARDADSSAALMQRALALLDAARPGEAVAALEALYAARRDFPALGATLLTAHTRARRRASAPAVSGFCVGDAVETVDELSGFWRAGDGATVVGVAGALAPLALRMDDGRLVDVQPDRVVRVERVFETFETPVDDYYTLLGASADFASIDELKRAYRKASLSAHPDKGGSPAKFERIADGFAILSDVEKRRAYDAGEDLSRPQAFSLFEEIKRHYFPELTRFEPFGDPLENRRHHDETRRRDEARRSEPSSYEWLTGRRRA
ncbi:hypothetical protein M885DRAFT_517185 [Pelagophyceae sp. CCMP2097]|nr:hypothetical protein M885DRAFT_517185 [Pelagophyceae sp. CCMP2097]